MSESEYRRWERRYQAEGIRNHEPSEFVVAAVAELGADAGSAIDLGGGTGRNALWLAHLGWQVTLVDISPTALELAAQEAAAAGVDLATQQVDLDSADPSGGPWDLVIVAHYLNRDLLGRMRDFVAPGGHLVVNHPTIENLAKHDRPRQEYLLQPGELDSLVRGAGLHVIRSFEGWTPQDRHEAQTIARAPA